MEIKPGKYLTRDKRQAVVHEVFEGRAFGRAQLSLTDSWIPTRWDEDGSSINGSPFDLIAPWEEPRLRVWRFNSLGSLNHGTIKIISGENTNPPSGWEPVPELDALFERREK